MRGRVSVRARFERFPATVKGAFIIRGEDRDPHQVVLREARVVAVPGHPSRPVPMASATLDVVPHRDIFVPFELTVSDFDPGWYGLECDLDVDGRPEIHPGGKRFVVPWPRATVRRGAVRVDEVLKLGDGTLVRLEQVECGGDSSRLHLRVDPPGHVTPRLSADGERLEVLSVDADEASGLMRVTAYPLLRRHAVLRLELRRKGRGNEAALDVRLP